MSTTVFQWDDLARFKLEGRFLDGYPADLRTFFSPRDDLHGLLKELLSSAQHSIVLNMFGYADEELDTIIRHKLTSEHIYVQMSLDKTQASSVHEQRLLAKWHNHSFGNSIAIGTSNVKHAISHLKILIVDGVYTVKGSTNWSVSGEGQQDNELTLSRNAVIAAETRAVLDLNHDWMLKQMAAERAKPHAKPKRRAA
jgi:phosphatidylserine/phosphatidylglycerophosphate/cardiolipin synthase-like enzyme